MARKRLGRYSVTGPDIDRTANSVGSGISLAQTLAGREPRESKEVTVYVRDEITDGGVIARIERRKDGTIETWCGFPSR